MHIKKEVSITSKILYVIMLLAILLSAFSVENLTTAHAQAETTATIEAGIIIPSSTENPLATPTLTDINTTTSTNLSSQSREGEIFVSDIDGFQVVLSDGWFSTSYSHAYIFYSQNFEYQQSDLASGAAINLEVFENADNLNSDAWIESHYNNSDGYSVIQNGQFVVVVTARADDTILAITTGNSRTYIASCEKATNYNLPCGQLLEQFISGFSLLSESPPFQNSDVSVLSTTSLRLPFRPGNAWRVVQGYRVGTHSGYPGYQSLSLDIRRDTNSTEQDTTQEIAVAPISGTKAWKDSKCMSVKANIPELGGSNYARVMICHVVFDQDFSSVTQGQTLGHIAPAGDPSYVGVAHIHISLYKLAQANVEGVRIPVALSSVGQNAGIPLDGMDYEDDGTSGKWTGFGPIYSSNYQVNTQTETYSSWLSWPGGWPHLFILDPGIRQFTIDSSSPYVFDNSSCQTVWVNLSPGNHSIVELYEARDGGTPTIEIKPWPVLAPPVCAGEPTNPPTGTTDTTLPTGSWSSPSNNQTIASRTVTLNVNASDNSGGSGVKEVRFSAMWGGTWRSVGNDSNSPYSLSWDMCSSGVPNGDIELGFEVWDNANNKWVYSENTPAGNIHINKNYNCTQSTNDTTPPTGSWSSPGNNQTISSQNVTLSVNASDNSGGSGVREVRWSAKWNNTWSGIGSDNSSPFSISWDMCASGVPSGDIELGFEVWDNANNKWVYSEHAPAGNIHINKNYTCGGSSGGYWNMQAWQNRFLAGFTNFEGTISWPNNYPYVDFDWGTGGPISGWGGNEFSIRLWKTINFPGGYYSFHAEHDDGVRVYYDNTMIIDAWWDGRGGHDAGINIPSGSHEIKVEYYENQGDALLKTFWYGPGYPAPDTNPPDGRITSPSNHSATASSPLTITADASDDVSGVNRVEFYAWYCSGSCNWHLISTDSSSPYSVTWDWSSLTDQHVTLTTHMIDNTGKVRDDPGGYVEVDLDRTQPTASITNPIDGALLSNIVPIQVSAYDSLSGVSAVQFIAGYSDVTGASLQSIPEPPAPATFDENGLVIASDVTAQDYWKDIGWDTDGSDGWSFNWDTSGVPEQSGIAVFVYVYDKAGNSFGAVRWDMSLFRAPSNDSITSPIQIGSFPYFGGQRVDNATSAGDDPAFTTCNRAPGDKTVWYRFTAPSYGQLYVSTSSSDYDTMLGLWTGSQGNLNLIDCNDDKYQTLQSAINTDLVGGTTYYLEVAEYNGVSASSLETQSSNKLTLRSDLSKLSTSQLVLDIDFIPSPPNDDINAAIEITTAPFTTTIDTSGATHSASDPEIANCNLGAGRATVWYMFIPTLNGNVEINTQGSTYDTILGIWSGSPGNLSPIACDDDFYGQGGASKVKFAVIGEVQYYVEIGNWVSMTGLSAQSLSVLDPKEIQAQSGGSLQLNFTYTVPAPTTAILQSPANNAIMTDYTPTLEWNDQAPLPDHYQLQVATINTFTVASILYDQATTSSDFNIPSNLTPGKTYYWRVRAFNGLGQGSAWSLVRSIKAGWLPPSLISPSQNEQLFILRPIFDWNDVPGATGYTIQISTNGVTFATPTTGNSVTSNFTPTVDLKKNITLYWRVQTKGLNGPSVWSEVRSLTSPNPPSAPVLSLPASNALLTDYTPLLKWSIATLPAGTTFDYYQVQVATDAAFSNLATYVNISSISNFFYTIPSDLAHNTKYYWRVRAVNSASGASNWSAVRTFRTFVDAPTLVSPNNGDNPITLRPSIDWNDVTGPAGVTGYTIQISKNSIFTQVVHTGNPITSNYTPIADLPKNITLYWHVQTKGANGPSAWSEVRSFNSANSPTTPALSLPAANALNTNYIPLFKWGAVTLPVGTLFKNYQLQVDDNTDFSSPVLDNTSITDRLVIQFQVVTPLAHNTKFYWRVRAVNTDNETGNWSAVRYFRTVVDAPTLLAPNNGFNASSLRPSFDWNDVAGPSAITGYTVQISKNNIFTQVVHTGNPVTSNYISIADLPKNLTLYWRVQTKGANGPSAWSEVRSFNSANSPTTPALSLPAANALNTNHIPLFKWTAVTLPVGTFFKNYQLQVDDNVDFSSPVINNTSITDRLTVQFQVVTPLAHNTKFYWRVRAVNTDNETGNWSAVRYFRTAMLPPTLISPTLSDTVTLIRPPFDWQDVAGPTSYTIQVSRYSNFSTLLVNATAVNSTYIPVVNMPRTVILYWRVRANGANGPSLWSDIQTFTIQ